MNFTILCSFLAASLLGMPHPTVATLDEVVSVGLANSSKIKAAKAAVEEARGNKNLARTALNPSVGGSAAGTVLDRSLETSLAGLNIVGANQWQGKVALDAELAIDINGDVRNQIRYADIGVQAATVQVLAVKNELTRDIRVACLHELQAQELLKTAQAASQNALQRRAVVQKQFDQGILTKFDILRSETEVADAAQKVIAAEDRVRVAHANIARLIEVPENQVPEITTSYDPVPSSETTDSYNLAASQRPELGIARLQVRAEAIGVRLAGVSGRPSLSFGIQSYALSNPGTFDPGHVLSSASLQLRIPLIDRGESRAREQSSKARLEESKWNLKSTEESVRFQVSQAISNLRDASERVQVAIRALNQAEEQYRIGEQRLEAGLTQGSLSPLLELSDSQTALTQAQNNLTNARIDVLVAQAELKYARGDSK